MNLGRAIYEIRKQKNITQKDLAVKCNLSIPALSCIERGKIRPSYKTVGVIAEGLGVSEGHLVLMSLEDKDIKPEKLPFFQMLKGVMSD